MKIEKDNVNFCLNLLAGKLEEVKLRVHYFYSVCLEWTSGFSDFVFFDFFFPVRE